MKTTFNPIINVHSIGQLTYLICKFMATIIYTKHGAEQTKMLRKFYLFSNHNTININKCLLIIIKSGNWLCIFCILFINMFQMEACNKKNISNTWFQLYKLYTLFLQMLSCQAIFHKFYTQRSSGYILDLISEPYQYR